MMGLIDPVTFKPNLNKPIHDSTKCPFKEKAEKWDKVTDDDNPHQGICNVEVNKNLQEENKQLKEKLEELRAQIAKVGGK